MIRFASWSGPGGHVENQDAFLVATSWQASSWHYCAVADGQGGQAGAAAAAWCAVQTFVAQVQQADTRSLGSSTNWLTWMRTVDEAVRKNPEAGYCAFVALAVSEDRVIGASSGDCAALAYCEGRQPVELTARQKKNPPVGSGVAEFTPFALPLTVPWTVLACTDGVWKYTGWDALHSLEALQPGAIILDSLRRKAVLPRTGELQDDFTLVVLQRSADAKV